MARFALALIAILILALSAGLTNRQTHGTSLGAGAASPADFYQSTNALRAELLLMSDQAMPAMAQRTNNQEPPAPALLIYLALILVGSAVAVALASRRVQREM
jgi:hypothetical protein